MSPQQGDRSSVCPQSGRPGFNPRAGKIPWRRQWHPTPALLPGKSHGQRSLIGCSPWGRKDSDMTERLHFHFQELYSAHMGLRASLPSHTRTLCTHTQTHTQACPNTYTHIRLKHMKSLFLQVETQFHTDPNRAFCLEAIR